MPEAMNDNAPIEPSKAFAFYAPVGSPAPTLAMIDAFDPAAPDTLAPGTNEIQTVTISGSPTGGSFTLTFGGQTTGSLARNVSAANLQTALEALSSIGAGNVLVSGTAGGPYTVTFVNRLGSSDVAQMTATATFTGGTSPGVTVATTTPGAAGPMSAWNHIGHTDLDEDFEPDEDGGDSESRGSRQNANLRERVKTVVEHLQINLIEYKSATARLYYGGGTSYDGYFDAPDAAIAKDYSTVIIYVDGDRRAAEYHPKTSIRRNGPIARAADGFLRFPLRLTWLKLAGQPVTRWFGKNFVADA